MLELPNPRAHRKTELLHGETAQLRRIRGPYCLVQADDGSSGYVLRKHMAKAIHDASHVVNQPAACIHATPDFKSDPLLTLPLGARIKVVDLAGEKVRLADGRWIYAGALRPIEELGQIAWELPERLLGAPYLWGGRSSFGIDCSGLAQLVLRWLGFTPPRNTQDQVSWSGFERRPSELEQLVFGDFIYVPGHVAMAVSTSEAIHACGSAGYVRRESIADLVRRRGAGPGDITINRLSRGGGAGTQSS